MLNLRYTGPGTEFEDPESGKRWVADGEAIEVSDKDAKRLLEYPMAHFEEVAAKDAAAPTGRFEPVAHPGTGQTVYQDTETGEVLGGTAAQQEAQAKEVSE